MSGVAYIAGLYTVRISGIAYVAGLYTVLNRILIRSVFPTKAGIYFADVTKLYLSIHL
jgi:hypothetical protein